MIQKDAILDLKNQYLQKRAEVEKQLASLLEETKNLKTNLNAFDGALACCDTILNGMEETVVEEPTVEEKPEIVPVDNKQQQSKRTRR